MPPGRRRCGRRRLARAARGNIDCGWVETKSLPPGRKFPPLHGPVGMAESNRYTFPAWPGSSSGVWPAPQATGAPRFGPGGGEMLGWQGDQGGNSTGNLGR